MIWKVTAMKGFGIIVYFLIGIILTMNFGCQFDKSDITGDPNDTIQNPGDTTEIMGDCDPNIVYFQKEVLPILTSSCAKSGCHDVGSHQEGVILDSYWNVINTGDIKPGNASGSDLYEQLVEDDPDKIMPPPPNAPLSADQINIIKKWIDQGAQDLTCTEGTACDISNVTFSATVRPILQNSCIGCHNATLSSGGINLTNYTGVQSVAVTGKLYGAISHTTGFVAMPQGGNKLSDCNIKKIKNWIDNGAPNN